MTGYSFMGGRRMEKRKRNKGFTLVETIVVLVILAILAVIVIPQFMRFINKAKRTACLADMSTVINEYQIMAVENPPKTVEEAREYLKKILESHNAKTAPGSTSFYTGGFYAGLCPEGGTYNCMFTNDFLYLSIDCTVHGDNIIDIKTLKDRLESINFNELEGVTYKTLEEYFKRNKSLDSEAKGTGGSEAYGEYGSFAAAVGAKLTQQGINTTNRSWRMYKAGGQYNLFLTDRKITQQDIGSGEWISCTKYDIVNQKILYGRVKVIKHDSFSFPIIDGGSFEEVS